MTFKIETRGVDLDNFLLSKNDEKEINIILNTLMQKKRVKVDLGSNSLYEYGILNNSLYRRVYRNKKIYSRRFLRPSDKVDLEIRNIFMYSNPFGNPKDINVLLLEFNRMGDVDLEDLTLKDLDSILTKGMDKIKKLPELKQIKLLDLFLDRLSGNGGRMEKSNKQETNKQETTIKQATEATDLINKSAEYEVKFAFNIDCIVEEVDTGKKGRVESLTVNKFHQKEYYIEGNGVSKWIAEKHLKLKRLPTEIKGSVACH